MLERLFSNLTKDEADRLVELKEENEELRRENKALHAANGDLQMLLQDAEDARDGWKVRCEESGGMTKYGVPPENLPEHLEMPEPESRRVNVKVRKREKAQFVYVDDYPEDTSTACEDDSKEEFYRKTIRSLRRQLKELADERKGLRVECKELRNKMQPKPSPNLITTEDINYLQGLMMDTVGLDGPDPEYGLHDLYQKLEDMKATILWRDQQLRREG